ncbi:protein C10-like [Biomphalaria glabrata]|uniref:Protein C10 n=1 Tax=Biomphalaria glabrata TaxID=6526 RepID=A0A9U8EC26_BIOGL|nr:protein C10-like [Biomphalaria glabrata]KAI8750785.1 protein C10 [Biomphalaria glabrata]
MAYGKPHLTLHECKGALRDILDTFNLPENVAKLDEARLAAGNDMLKSMQNIFPTATQMQIQVIERYGFLADGEGLVQFTKVVRSYEDQDPDVRLLNSQVRSILLPPVTVTHPNVNQNGGS